MSQLWHADSVAAGGTQSHQDEPEPWRWERRVQLVDHKPSPKTVYSISADCLLFKLMQLCLLD